MRQVSILTSGNCLWKASSICISQDCQTDLSSIRPSSLASKATSSRGARTPTNQTLCLRYSGTNAYLAQKSSLLIAQEISVTRPDILLCASGKQVQYASVKTVRLTYQALELLHGRPKRQVQGALGHQQIKHSASDVLAQMPTLLKNPHCLLRKRFLKRALISCCVPLESKFNMHQSRLSDWPIKHWSFFTGVQSDKFKGR